MQHPFKPDIFKLSVHAGVCCAGGRKAAPGRGQPVLYRWPRQSAQLPTQHTAWQSGCPSAAHSSDLRQPLGVLQPTHSPSQTLPPTWANLSLKDILVNSTFSSPVFPVSCGSSNRSSSRRLTEPPGPPLPSTSLCSLVLQFGAARHPQETVTPPVHFCTSGARALYPALAGASEHSAEPPAAPCLSLPLALTGSSWSSS